jgi:DNA-binding MarR family transcriptional regulator
MRERRGLRRAQARLVKGGYIETTKSPEHARKRLVTITSKGNEVVAQGRHLLDTHFDQLMLIADIV